MQDKSYFSVVGDETESFAVFKITYNQNIYIKGADGVSRLLSDPSLQTITAPCPNGNQKFAEISKQLVGMFNINCNSDTGAVISMPMLSTVNLCAPLTGMPIFGQPMADSAGAFVNLYKGGVSIDEVLRSDTMNFIVPLVTPELRAFFSRGLGTCNFQRRAAAQNLVNAEGTLLNSPDMIKGTPSPPCTSAEANLLGGQMRKIKVAAEGTDNFLLAEQVQISVNCIN